ncbi:hypothetical protein ACTMU2_07820 [Cupriavidus basilensis]
MKFAREIDLSDDPPKIYALSGDNLLATIASADVIEIDDCRSHPATRIGQLVLDDAQIATTDEIIEALLKA